MRSATICGKGGELTYPHLSLGELGELLACSTERPHHASTRLAPSSLNFSFQICGKPITKAIWCMVFGVILDTLSHFLTLSPIGFPSFSCLFFSFCKLMSHCFPAYVCLMRPQRSFYRDLFKGSTLSLSKFSQDFLFIHVIFRNLIVVCLDETFLIWTVWSFLNFLNWWAYF